VKRAPAIWNFVCPLLHLPEHSSPRVDQGNSWHNIIINNVPVSVDTVPPGSTAQEHAICGIDSWLEVACVVDRINEMSFMCTDAILPTCETAPLRVSLSSRRDADLLIQNGALVLGSRCRVSQYVPKARS
jgi:hypothetical protein